MVGQFHNKERIARQVKERKCVYGKGYTRQPAREGRVYHIHHFGAAQKNGTRHQAHYQDQLHVTEIVKGIQDSERRGGRDV